MSRARAGLVSVAAVAGFLLASSSAGGALVPARGTYSGTTATGEPISYLVGTKKAGHRLQAEGVKRTARVRRVTGAVPISCNDGLSRSEEIGFPGPLSVNEHGRFAVTGIGQQLDGDRVTTRVAGRFTGKRKASGTLFYSGGFDGEFCTGAITWTAARK